MTPTRIARLGVVVLVIAAVAVVLRFKQADSASGTDDTTGAINRMALTDRSRTTPPQADDTDSSSGEPAQSEADPAPADVALPRLLDLGADKCIPCKKMAPILDALREDFAGQFEVVFIDVWRNRQEAGRYGIKLIPTQIFFDDEGNELLRHEGFFSREDILATWSDLGHVFEAPRRDESG